MKPTKKSKRKPKMTAWKATKTHNKLWDYHETEPNQKTTPKTKQGEQDE
jgi:hypothetical protein